MAECLPLMHIRNVNFHEWDIHACQSISQSNTCMRQGARVDYDGVNVPSRLMYAINDRALPVGLEMREGYGERLALILGLRDYVGEGG